MPAPAAVGSSLSDVKNTLFAMVATYLFAGTRDFITDFPNVPIDTKVDHRYIAYENIAKLYIVNRSRNDVFVAPGVNLYFGDPVASKMKDLPQRMFLPVMIHVMVPYTDEHRVGEAQAERLSELIQNSFEGIGGQQKLYDFYVTPALALTGRNASWAKEYRGQWRELGDPTKETFTNRQWTFQVRYVR